MKANELRIGNCIRCKEPNKELYFYEVRSISESEIGVVYYPDKTQTAGIQYETEIISVPFDFIESIPLTEEILLKCGFEKYEKGEDVFFKKGDFFHLCKFDVYGGFGYECGDNLGGNYINNRIDYLHQLQNIYVISIGEELEVKL